MTNAFSAPRQPRALGALRFAGLAASLALSVVAPRTEALGADLGAWVEDLLTGSAEETVPAGGVSLATLGFTPEHDFFAEWKRTSPFGRENGERFRQEVDAKLASDFGNGVSTELSTSFETLRGPRKGEDTDGLEATGIVAFDVLGYGARAPVFLAQKEQALEDAADVRSAQARGVERLQEAREALVDYVRYACLQKALERARTQVDEAWERTRALRQASALSKKDELAVRALQAETVASLELVSAELQAVAPRVLAEGVAVHRRVAAADFSDEAFCLPSDAFEPSTPAPPSEGGTPKDAPTSRVGVARADADVATAEAQAEIARLERARARTRPKLAPFLGVGWEQEGGEGAGRTYILGVRLEATFGGYEESTPRLFLARQAAREERVARVLAAETEQARPALKRRRARAFQAARARYEAAAAFRANEEAQWKAGLVSASDFTKASLDATDAYEDLFEAWREAALLGR